MSEMRKRGGGPLNHKVISVTDGGTCDVYDLTVSEYENFAISAGVFIHNCPQDFQWNDAHMINDKQLVQIFSKIPAGCTFSWGSDSCHSQDLSRDIIGDMIRPQLTNPFAWIWHKLFGPKQVVKTPKTIRPPDHIAARIALLKSQGHKSRGIVGGLLDVGFISGCKIDQTSADAYINNVHCGAMTASFLQVVKQNPRLSIADTVAQMNSWLVANGYDQSPCSDGAQAGNPFLNGPCSGRSLEKPRGLWSWFWDHVPAPGAHGDE